jgi:hypothetical protein
MNRREAYKSLGVKRFGNALWLGLTGRFFKRLQLTLALGLVLGFWLVWAMALRLRLSLGGQTLPFDVAHVNNEAAHSKADDAADDQQNDAWSFHGV